MDFECLNLTESKTSNSQNNAASEMAEEEEERENRRSKSPPPHECICGKLYCGKCSSGVEESAMNGDILTQHEPVIVSLAVVDCNSKLLFETTECCVSSDHELGYNAADRCCLFTFFVYTCGASSSFVI